MRTKTKTPALQFPTVVVPFPLVVASSPPVSARDADGKFVRRRVCAARRAVEHHPVHVRYQYEQWYLRVLHVEKVLAALALRDLALPVLVPRPFWACVFRASDEFSEHLTPYDHTVLLPHLVSVQLEQITGCHVATNAERGGVTLPRGFRLRFQFSDDREGSGGAWELLKEYHVGCTLWDRDLPRCMQVQTSRSGKACFWLRSITSTILSEEDPLPTRMRDFVQATSVDSFFRWFALLPEHDGPQPWAEQSQREGDSTSRTLANRTRYCVTLACGDTDGVRPAHRSYDRAVEDFSHACYLRDVLIPAALDVYLEGEGA